ncbi:hypothetical protein [Pseudomonas typographi]|uniref:hypothetical protein n=1 Tax=Pseudomonas typographi TaxID=2715964 RepID=UPI001683D62F|nr:hypothetical protein [Pseudomonas typographi]MBD1552438.1 hypothetical protein [Pseudomonas typographi]
MTSEEAQRFLGACIAEITRATVASSCQAFYRKSLALIQDMAECGLIDGQDGERLRLAAAQAHVHWALHEAQAASERAAPMQ